MNFKLYHQVQSSNLRVFPGAPKEDLAAPQRKITRGKMMNDKWTERWFKSSLIGFKNYLSNNKWYIFHLALTVRRKPWTWSASLSWLHNEAFKSFFQHCESIWSWFVKIIGFILWQQKVQIMFDIKMTWAADRLPKHSAYLLSESWFQLCNKHHIPGVNWWLSGYEAHDITTTSQLNSSCFCVETHKHYRDHNIQQVNPRYHVDHNCAVSF